MEAPDGFLVITLAFIGALITVLLRFNQKHRRGWRSTLSVLYNDYTFEEYATLNLLSFIYAAALGGLTGAGAGFLIQTFFGNPQSNFTASATCFLLIPAARIAVEGYTVVYKTAKDASAFLALSSRHLLKSDPSLQERPAWVKKENTLRTRFGYESNEIFNAIVDELNELGIDTSMISYESTSFADNMVIVASTSGEKIAIFTRHTDGEWTRELL